MTMSALGEKTLLDFFQQLFSRDEGFICIATTRPPARKDTFNEQFFEWPVDADRMLDYVEKVTPTHNVYFGINVWSVPRRKKENAIPQNLVWADLDSCHPSKLEIPPQTVISSSPGRYQAVWKLDQKVDPLLAESYSKRLAYLYRELGVDDGGWDLTQLLRVPGTNNFKYEHEGYVPSVDLIADLDEELPKELFDNLPHVDDSGDIPDIPIPDLSRMPDYNMILYKHKERLEESGQASIFSRYVAEEPRENWSKQLWRLHLLCLDVGMTAEETFVVAKNAKCNKYERDGRPDSHLWREILKAENERKTVEVLLQDHRYLVMPSILSAQEIENLQPTLIDDYMDWATEASDAVPEYHELCCAMLMSAFLATTLRLPTGNELTIVPNLWGLVIGESTLTRKSTAMDMAMKYILEIDPDMMVTSDSTMEGLMTALSVRPKMVSIFYRDEITGFFNSVQRKDYLSGMHEALTKMYDVPPLLKRTLRKDTYVVAEPIFMMFGGGIANRLYSLIDEEYITSGFIPRFLFVHGQADINKVKPLGPPQGTRSSKRADLLSTFNAFYNMYTNVQDAVQMPDGRVIVIQPTYNVEFTDAMWQRASEIEYAFNAAAQDSPESDKALPTFSRLYTSMIKLTMLFAGARQEPTDGVIRAEMRDLLSAAYYIQKWGVTSVHVIRNSGHTSEETKLQACYRSIEARPGMPRSEIMQRHRLNARDMDLVETTLIQRAMIEVVKKGGRFRYYWPTGR